MTTLWHAATRHISHIICTSYAPTLLLLYDALTGETPLSSASPSPIPTTGLPELTNSSKIPICRVDPNGFFIPPNDPRYIAPTTQFRESSTITFTEAKDKLGDMEKGLGIISGVGGISDLPVVEQLGKYRNVLAVLGPAATVLGSSLELLGPILGLQSQDDILLDVMKQGFQQVTSQLNTIQFQLKAGFLELTEFIADVALDEINSRLMAHQHAFNAYVNATYETRPIYEPKWRTVCNAPFLTPENLFYDLYGYVCDKCTFGIQKRADFYKQALESNPISSSNFFSAFANVMLRGMSQAMALHSMCPPPTEGSCADRPNDGQWTDGIKKMEQALNEAINRIENDVKPLDDFVPTIVGNRTELDEIEKFYSSNKDLAKNILDFFVQRQPGYHFQILVQSPNDQLNRNNIWRSTDGTFTNRVATGHFYLEYESRDISIRYRSKSLNPVETNIFSNELYYEFNGRLYPANVMPFPLFHQEMAKQNLPGGSQEGSLNSELAKFDFGDAGCQGDGENPSARACAASVCLRCSDDLTKKFDEFMGYFFIGRVGFDGFSFEEATDNEAVFPRNEVKFAIHTFLVFYGR